MNSLHDKVSSLSVTQPKEEDDSEKIMQCPICQKKAEKKCSFCKLVAYCCVDHQTLDWKNHKNTCQTQAFSIKKTEDMDGIEAGDLKAQPNEDTLKDIQQCPVCQENADKMCSACKSVAYCGVQHQKLDWKNHKKVCQPFVIKQTENMGLGWFATRDLPAGFLLLEEGPALQVPGFNWKSGSVFSDNFKKCLGCGVIQDSVKFCSTCSWPVCSKECEKNPVHLENECKEFVSRKLKYPSPAHWPVGMLALCIRANKMKARDPKKFDELMALQDFKVVPSSNQELQEIDLPIGMFEVLKGSDRLDREEYRKLLRIFQVNCLKSGLSPCDAFSRSDISDQTFCILLKACRLNHSCFSNCTTRFSPGPVRKFRIYTSIPVIKGDQLTFNYFESKIALPGIARQCLIKSVGFICKCKRCADPTESGSFLSGFKCFNCSSHLKADSNSDNVGFLLPENPLAFDSPLQKLKCHRCHYKAPYFSVIDTLPSTVQQAFFNPEKWMRANDIRFLEEVLKIYDESRDFKDYLHPNHFLIQQAMRAVIKKQDDELSTLTEQDLKIRIRRLEFLLKIDDKLFPGLSLFRYEELAMLENTVMSLASIAFDNNWSKEAVQELGRKFRKAREERLKFLDLELFRMSEEEKQKLPEVLETSQKMANFFESLDD